MPGELNDRSGANAIRSSSTFSPATSETSNTLSTLSMKQPIQTNLREFNLRELKLIQECLNTGIWIQQKSREQVDEGSEIEKFLIKRAQELSAIEWDIRNAIQNHPENPAKHVQTGSHQGK
jgi:hypothetical protein